MTTIREGQAKIREILSKGTHSTKVLARLAEISEYDVETLIGGMDDVVVVRRNKTTTHLGLKKAPRDSAENRILDLVKRHKAGENVDAARIIFSLKMCEAVAESLESNVWTRGVAAKLMAVVEELSDGQAATDDSKLRDILAAASSSIIDTMETIEERLVALKQLAEPGKKS